MSITPEELEGIRLRHESADRQEHHSEHTLWHAHEDRQTLLLALTEAQERAERAEAALKPFARFLDVRENMRGLTGTADDADDSPMFECVSSVNGVATLTAGDFRRARAAQTLKERKDV